MNMSMYDLVVLTSCAMMNDPLKHPLWAEGTLDRSIVELVKEGMISNTNPSRIYRPTAKGQKWLDHVRGIPQPVEKTEWVIPTTV